MFGSSVLLHVVLRCRVARRGTIYDDSAVRRRFELYLDEKWQVCTAKKDWWPRRSVRPAGPAQVPLYPDYAGIRAQDAKLIWAIESARKGNLAKLTGPCQVSTGVSKDPNIDTFLT